MAKVRVRYLVDGYQMMVETVEKQPAIGEVVRIGARNFEVRVLFHPDKYTAYGEPREWYSCDALLAPQLKEVSHG